MMASSRVTPRAAATTPAPAVDTRSAPNAAKLTSSIAPTSATYVSAAPLGDGRTPLTNRARRAAWRRGTGTRPAVALAGCASHDDGGANRAPPAASAVSTSARAAAISASRTRYAKVHGGGPQPRAAAFGSAKSTKGSASESTTSGPSKRARSVALTLKSRCSSARTSYSHTTSRGPTSAGARASAGGASRVALGPHADAATQTTSAAAICGLLPRGSTCASFGSISAWMLPSLSWRRIARTCSPPAPRTKLSSGNVFVPPGHVSV